MKSMNNINVKVMQEFVEAVKKDPRQAKKQKRVTGSWKFKKGPQFVSTVEYPKGRMVLKTELPGFAGGWGTSPDPIQYCLHGLAACFAVTFAATATAEGVKLTRLEVTAENWMNLQKQLGLSKKNIIEKIKLMVTAEGASKKVLNRILKLTEDRCPGTECVTKKIPLKVEFK